MCGIVGLLADSGPGVGERVREALLTLAHRGPDSVGLEERRIGGVVCLLGHTRLRILDLSPNADQPLANEDRTILVSYNGEIYNHRELRADLEKAGHRFRSRTDTEVLVHLYEECGGDAPRMLERLRGMFAFALVDERRGRLLLARDRLGIKPLYWAETPRGIAFASEVRALVRTGAVSSEPEPDAVAGYLRRGVVLGPAAIVRGARELPPGSYLLWEDGRVRVARWWRPEWQSEESIVLDAQRLLEAGLDDAVERHLLADRPVGVFLSGGVDSGAIATLASKRGQIRALTVTFPEASEDEGRAAAAVAGRLGAEHVQIPVTGREVAGILPEILRSMDQPTSDGTNTWLVCRAAREAGLVVALSGVGGDELFGGYPTFRLVPLAARATALLRAIPPPVRRSLGMLAARRAPGGRAARMLASPAGYAGAYLAVRGLLSLFDGAALDYSALPAGTNGELWDGGPNSKNPADLVSHLEMLDYLPNQLLRDTDQMSMAHSIEVRVPLLDDVVVRIALALPSRVRTSAGKRLLAQAARLDAAAPKRPFSLPFEEWIRGPLREPVLGALLSEELPFGNVVPARLRRRLWEGFEAGRVHWSRPWAIAVLRLWPEANGFSWR